MANINNIDIKTQVSEISKLKKELKQQREYIEEDFNSTMHLHSIALGDISLQNANISDAFCNYLWAIYYSLKLNNEYIDYSLIVSNLEYVANNLTDVSEKAILQIRNTDSKIRELPKFKYIMHEYDKAYNIYISKISNQNK